jgi:LysM repeat protein
MLCRAVRTERHHLRIRASRVALWGALALALLGTKTLSTQEETPRAHTVKRGDTLWDLAKLYLGDSFLWPEIYRLNTDVIDDPHWIYPGEVLKLPAPGATPTVAEAPPPVKQAGEPAPTTPPAPAPAAPSPTATGAPVYEPPVGVLDGPTVFPQSRVDLPVSKRKSYARPAMPTVKLGTFLSAPFVDRKGGPRGAGDIVKVLNLSVTASGRDPKARAQLHDEIFITPPVGSAAAEGERYVTYKFGPFLDDVGQVVIPTGVVEVTRAPRDREAAIAQVIRMFGEIEADQHLLPYDSTALHVIGHPEPIVDSVVTEVKAVSGDPILPSVQNYLLVDVSARDGIKIGDEFELFEPRSKSEVSGAPANPEIAIAHAQAVRVTRYGTTLMIMGERHPKIEPGTLAKRVASMP